MPRVTYTCECCGKERTVDKWYYDQLYKNSNKPKACSVKCGSKLRERGNRVTVVCPNCGSEHSRKLSHKDRLFCNSGCYGEYRSSHPEQYPPPKINERTMRILRARTGKNNPAYGMTGDKSPHWKGGRDSYRGRGWKTIRKLIKKRDDYTCVLCGKGKDQIAQLDIHHIYDWAETECNHPHNLITVCSSCHQGRIHGSSQSPPRRQLANIALQSTRASLEPDDLQLIERLDRQQRCDKPLPQYISETL